MLLVILLVILCFSILVGVFYIFKPKTNPRNIRSSITITGDWKPPTQEQIENMRAERVIDMKICNDTYGSDHLYTSMPSIGGETVEKATENGTKRVCKYASELLKKCEEENADSDCQANAFMGLNRDMCRSREYDAILQNYNQIPNIQPYVDAMKDTCGSLIKNSIY